MTRARVRGVLRVGRGWRWMDGGVLLVAGGGLAMAIGGWLRIVLDGGVGLSWLLCVCWCEPV